MNGDDRWGQGDNVKNKIVIIWCIKDSSVKVDIRARRLCGRCLAAEVIGNRRPSVRGPSVRGPCGTTPRSDVANFFLVERGRYIRGN